MNNTSTAEYSAREKKASWHAIYWSFAWGFSIPLGCAGAIYLPVSTLLVGMLALGINVAIGVGAVRAYVRLLNSLDEMQRQIQLESMAMAFGALWIAFGSLLILNAAELIHIDRWEVSLLPVVASLVMAIGNVVGVRKYQ